ncbi:angiomotin-like protein 1 isoform X2 [Stylophora pistillata]|uniref:angiomotin-like protein 1 isoform X2 n=1 Tax=Stylophora pistillata TaxID=50429 RepID=UPI000C05102C|nr:angiomotin-like protein 1 isoform X2 [Stylophora pistillata]
MDWNADEVADWLKEIRLSKYAKRFKDDLEVTNCKDREILLKESSKLASIKSKQPAVPIGRDFAKNTQTLSTPLITVSNFDDDDDEQKLIVVYGDDQRRAHTEYRSNEKLPLNQRVINFKHSVGGQSVSDDSSDRDFSLTDSHNKHHFDICDEDPNRPVDPTPTASAVATRATQMVELLSSDNVALREKLQSVYYEMSRMQKVESELEILRTAYEELQISFRKRENLEYSTRTRIETEMKKLRERNRNLKAELEKCKSEVEQGKNSLENFKRELKLKNEVIRQLICQNSNFISTREELEGTINQQNTQIGELERDKDLLSSSLAQSRERITCLQNELEQKLHTNYVSSTGMADGLHVTESNPVDEGSGSTTADEIRTRHRHSISADEGIAELDGPTSIPVLLEMLREKDERIQVLEDNLSRLEQTLMQEGTSRSLAIKAVSVPKEARIVALEKSIQEREKIIAECRAENLKSVEELYVANRRCADLESIIKSLHSQLAEKTARIHILQNNNSDELSEPEWPLDPAYCRTDFVRMRELARDSYAESLDSGMSLTNALDAKQTDPEFKTMDEPDELSVHFWSV